MIAIFLLLSVLAPWEIEAGADRPVVVVECLKRPPYKKTIEEFVEVCNGEVVRLFVADMDEADVLELIKEYDPRLILAVGWDALVNVRNVQKTPVLYVHALHTEKL